MDRIQRYRGCLLGLAVGDAVGTTVEFKPRGTFQPVVDMLGMGPFDLKPGEWTDDTSMALCLATSLLERGGFDAQDQMERYWNWYQYGYLSSNGRCFDIGSTTRAALLRYKETGDPFSGSTDPSTAGNGSLMRLAPVVLFYSPDLTQVLDYAAASSRTTHGALECVEACRLLGGILHNLLQGAGKAESLINPPVATIDSPAIQNIAAGRYINKSEAGIQGSGYVVSSLEAALWSFWTTETFEEAILKAVNLGEDADTTAAICGQLAGAFYGEPAIPRRWLDRLVMRQEITRLAEGLYKP